MLYFKKNSCFLITFLFLVFTIHLPALDKDRLVSFLVEYDSSQEKFMGKINYAIENGYPDVAEFLIQRGEIIDPSSYAERYPLSFNPLEYNRSADLQNIYYKHPLLTAIRKGYKEVALLMIQLGVGNKAEEYKIEYKKFSGTEEIERKNAMYVAIEECEDGYDIVLSLLAHGFDVNNNKNLNPIPNPEKNGYKSVYTTPLLQAIASKKLDIAALLLDYGADVEKVSRSTYLYNGEYSSYPFTGTPLLKAVDDNFIEGVLLLLSNKADPLHGSNISPLERAIEKGYLDIVDVLLDATIVSDN